jgi:hypothetical protein
MPERKNMDQKENAASRASVESFVHPFALGELWAGGNGMKCEFCDRRAFGVWLSKDELKRIPANRNEAALIICQEKLGRILCEDHQPQIG